MSLGKSIDIRPKSGVKGILFFFFHLTLFSNAFLYPQIKNLKFECLSIEQGLSQNTVNCIYQDSRGFLWFGTQDGLNKFDGYNFTTYKYDPSDSNSPSDNNFLTITEDNNGDLWLGTELGGMNKYDYQTGKFIKFKHNPDNPNSISSDYVSVIYKDKSGLLWIGTQPGGLDEYNPKTKKIRHYKFNKDDINSLSNNYVYAICEDADGSLWIGTYNGLNKFDKHTGKFTRYFLEKYISAKAKKVPILSLFIERKGLLWIGTAGEGLITFDQKQNTFTRFKNLKSDKFSISNDVINTIFEDFEGRIWIGTENGFNEFDRSQNKFYRYYEDHLDPLSISDNNIVFITEDRSHNLWLGSYNGGVNKLVKGKEKFTHIKSNYIGSKNLSVDKIFSFCEDRYGNLWIGTYDGGLNKWDRKTNEFTYYKNSQGNSNSIISNRIWAIFADEYDCLWIGTDNGLDKLDIKTNRFTHYKNNKNDPFGLSDNNINSLYIDDLGNIWIGTWIGGLDCFDRHSNKFYHFKNIPGNDNSIASNAILTTIQDRERNIWIGTWGNGLDKYNPLTQKFSHYTYNSKDPKSINSNSILSLCEDISGNYIWIGTNGDGLNKLDTRTGKFKHYTVKEGLPNNIVYGILSDDEGNLWLSTNKGICKFNPVKNSFLYYSVKNGLQSNEFNQNAYFKNKKGEMFFGGINGFNVFYPKEITMNKYIPPIVITSFKKFDKNYSFGKPISEIKEIELSYEDYMFSFDFAALDYTLPENNQYAYKMEGLDKDWIQVANNHSATFTNLNPGRYVFRVKGTNSDGKWNEEGISIIINIRPPFWQTWWFRIIITIAIILLLISYFKYRTKKIKQQNIKLEKLVKERTQELNEEISIRKRTEESLKKSEAKLKESNDSKDKFFSLMAHDLKSPFSSLLGFSSMLKENLNLMSSEEVKNSISLLNKSVKRIYNLVENLLEWSRLQINRIEFNPLTLDLKKLANRAINFLEVNALNKRVTISNKISDDTFVYCDENMIVSVFQNLISNAIKFTDQGGNVIIETRELEDCFEISVSDDGIGIEQNNLEKLFKIDFHHSTLGTGDEKGTGLGLILCKELIEKNSGHIRVESEIGKGSTFIFSLLKPVTVNSEAKIINKA